MERRQQWWAKVLLIFKFLNYTKSSSGKISSCNHLLWFVWSIQKLFSSASLSYWPDCILPGLSWIYLRNKTVSRSQVMEFSIRNSSCDQRSGLLSIIGLSVGGPGAPVGGPGADSIKTSTTIVCEICYDRQIRETRCNTFNLKRVAMIKF